MTALSSTLARAPRATNVTRTPALPVPYVGQQAPAAPSPSASSALRGRTPVARCATVLTLVDDTGDVRGVMAVRADDARTPTQILAAARRRARACGATRIAPVARAD